MGGTIEGDGVRSSWLNVQANGVTIDGLTARNPAAGAVQTGSLDITGRANTTLRHLRLVGGSYAAIRIWNGSTNTLIEDSDIGGAPVVGVTGWASSSVTIRRTHIHDIAGFNSSLDEGGGVKLGKTTSVLIEDSEVDHTAGPGIWADVTADAWTIQRNRVHDVGKAAIMFEISDGATIANNVVWEAGWGRYASEGSLTYAAAILVSSSAHAVLTGNTCAWSPTCIGFVAQSRSPAPPAPYAGDSSSSRAAVSAGHQMTGLGEWGATFARPLTLTATVATPADLAAAGIPAAPLPGH